MEGDGVPFIFKAGKALNERLAVVRVHTCVDMWWGEGGAPFIFKAGKALNKRLTMVCVHTCVGVLAGSTAQAQSLPPYRCASS